MAKELRKRFDLKVRGVLGSGPKDDKSIRILNRIVSSDEHGVTYGCDQRHAEIVLKQLKIKEEGVKSVVAPGIKQDPGESKPLDSAMASQYRSLTMRLNYLAQDRADICSSLGRNSQGE